MRLVDKFFVEIAWILTGICFAIACSMMWISGSFDLNRFYQTGEVYDVTKTNLKLNGNYDIDYDEENNSFTVKSETAAKVFVIPKGKWNYIYLYASQTGEEGVDVSLGCYNEENITVYEADVKISEGVNILTVPGVRYNRMNLNFRQKAGTVFGIDQIQFREKPPIFSKSRFIKYMLLFLGGFLLVTGIAGILIQKKLRGGFWYGPVHSLQKLFCRAGKVGEGLDRICSPRQKDWIQRGVFCSMFLYMQVCYVLNLTTIKTFRYFTIPCVLGILVIAVLCWEKPLTYLNWNNKLAASWFCLWLMAVISDFIVGKRYAFMGYIMIFAIGFLFFMWGNMKKRERLLLNFMRGIEWSFWPNIIFCYLFRPYIPGYRYLGAAFLPGFFGMYLLFVWISFLTELDFDFKKKHVLGKDLFFLAALGICGNLIWRTQTMSAILPAIFALFIFSFKLWKKRKQVKIFGFVVYIVVFCIGYKVDEYCIYQIPRQVNSEIRFKKDLYENTVTDHPFTMEVKAGEQMPVNRIFYKLKTSASLEELTTGRTLFWKAYLRDMNLWGHRSNAHFWGGSHMAHNGLLAIMHRYGIFAGVPYVLMLFYNICFAWRYFKRHLLKDRSAYFVLANVFSCCALLLVENIELPFCWVYWYALYIVMGIYFDDERVGNLNEELERI